MTGALQRLAVAELIERAESLGVDVPGEVRAIVHGTGSAGATLYVRAHPRARRIYCCWGDAEYGPGDCTCWQPVYDVDQAEPRPPADPAELESRGERCGDCAYRPGSPELAEEYTRETLLSLPARGEPFWCHDGMRRPVAYVHPKRGRIDADPDDWQPPVRGRLPFRADGSPALLCAGWAAIAAKARTR